MELKELIGKDNLNYLKLFLKKEDHFYLNDPNNLLQIKHILFLLHELQKYETLSSYTVTNKRLTFRDNKWNELLTGYLLTLIWSYIDASNYKLYFNSKINKIPKDILIKDEKGNTIANIECSSFNDTYAKSKLFNFLNNTNSLVKTTDSSSNGSLTFGRKLSLQGNWPGLGEFHNIDFEYGGNRLLSNGITNKYSQLRDNMSNIFSFNVSNISDKIEDAISLIEEEQIFSVYPNISGILLYTKSPMTGNLSESIRFMLMYNPKSTKLLPKIFNRINLKIFWTKIEVRIDLNNIYI